MKSQDPHPYESLAQGLWVAYCAWEADMHNVYNPRWFALREDIKDRWRENARAVATWEHDRRDLELEEREDAEEQA